jgi:oligopeptide transport system substrate-binding protein
MTAMVLGTGLVLAACGGGGTGGKTGNNILNRGTASEPPSLDPHLAQGNSASALLDDLFVGLTTTDSQGKLIGGLAESWAVSDDGLSWTFKLRPGLLWSDGTPITAADVVWSLQRLMDPKTAARYASNLFVVKGGRAVSQGAPMSQLGISAPDERTILFQLERPVPYFAQILASNATVPVPRHLIEKEGRNWTKPGTMVSNGAFTLTEWVPNTRISAAKNAKFYDAANVKIDGVVYYPTDNTGTLVNRYRAGEVDVILNFPPDQTEFLRKNFGDQVQISPNQGLYYYMFNTKRPPFDNVKVREALSLAVSREALTKQVLKGDAEPAWTLVPSDISGFKRLPPADAAIPQPERVAKAKALLAEAGYGAGKPLAVELRYDSKEDSRQIAVAIGDMWKAIGVTPTLKASDFRGITADARSGRFQVIRYQWFAPFDDPSTFLALVRGRSATNLTGFSDPKFDAAVAAADALPTAEARMAKLAEAERDVMGQYPVLPIYFTTARRLVSPRVQGWDQRTGNNVQTRWLSLKDSGSGS